MSGPIDVGSYKTALVLLATAAIVVPLMKRLQVSPVLGFLAAGTALGPHALGRLADRVPWLPAVGEANSASLEHLAELGVVFLLFLIGLELSWPRLMTMRRIVFGLGTAQVLLCGLAIGLAAFVLGETAASAIVIGGALALSSTAVVVEVLSQARRLTSATGRASFSVLLFQDLAVVPLILLVGLLGMGGPGLGASLAQALLQGAVAIAIIVLVGRRLLKPLFRHTAIAGNPELTLAASLLVIVGTGLITALAGLSMALGAFLAGLFLAETEYRKAIESIIEPFKSLLLGVFFFSVGMSLDLGLLASRPLELAAVAVGIVALKAAIIVPLARLFGVTPATAVKSALLLGACGEFAFVLIGLAGQGGIVAPPTAGFVIAAATLSMFAIPALDWLGRRLTIGLDPAPADPALAETPPADSRPKALVIGYGRVGSLVSEMLERHRVPYLTIDSHAPAVGRPRRAGKPVYFGDATSPLVLRACGIETATAVIVTVHSRDVTDLIVLTVRSVRPDILIISRAHDANHARHLYELGVDDAVPETIEASLQVSEAALVGLGIPMGPVIASIHERRDLFRAELQSAAGDGRVTRALPAKRRVSP